MLWRKVRWKDRNGSQSFSQWVGYMEKTMDFHCFTRFYFYLESKHVVFAFNYKNGITSLKSTDLVKGRFRCEVCFLLVLYPLFAWCFGADVFSFFRKPESINSIYNFRDGKELIETLISTTLIGFELITFQIWIRNLSSSLHSLSLAAMGIYRC